MSIDLTPEQIEFLDKYAPGRWSINSETGLVDVDGDFICSFQNLTDFSGVRFGSVSGNFWCHSNQLSSLEGAPQSVGGNFWCHDNGLSSLEGAPQSVGGDFDCSLNRLRSLEGAPRSVGGGFYCANNDLKSLEGAPQSVGVGFYCSNNDLKSLEGAPQSVGGDFVCDDFKLGSGQWNLQHWIRMLENSDGVYEESVKDLITTLTQFHEEADLETRKLIKFQRMKNML